MNTAAAIDEKKEVREQKGLMEACRTHLFQNNYALVSSLKLSLPMACFLLIFEQLQKFSIISRLASNPTIANSSEMSKVDLVARYMLLDVL
jgi:hypothetical protein